MEELDSSAICSGRLVYWVGGSAVPRGFCKAPCQAARGLSHEVWWNSYPGEGTPSVPQISCRAMGSCGELLGVLRRGHMKRNCECATSQGETDSEAPLEEDRIGNGRGCENRPGFTRSLHDSPTPSRMWPSLEHAIAPTIINRSGPEKAGWRQNKFDFTDALRR